MGTTKSTKTTNLYQLNLNYERKKILKPDFQREFIWDKLKRKAFKDTINKNFENKGGVLPNPIITFETKDNPGVIYLGDGLQRISTAQEYSEQLKKEKFNNKIEEIFEATEVVTHHIEYKDMKEAREDFMRMNEGTGLTSYERGKVILTQLSDFDSWDKNIFTELNSILEKNIAYFGIKPSKLDKDKRIYLEFFYTYLTGYSEVKTYLDKNLLTKEKMENAIESHFYKFIVENKKTVDETEKNLSSFETYINEIGANIREIWEEIKKDASFTELKEVPTQGIYLYLLRAWFYYKNNDIVNDDVEIFVKKFLEFTKGSTGSGGGLTATVIAFNTIKQWEKKLGIQFKKREKPNISQLKAGKQAAHKKSFSKNPLNTKQDFIPQSGTRNKSNGTRDLE